MTQSAVQVYGIFPYDRGAKVRWLLTELGVAFENKWLDRDSKEFESPAYLKINPLGRIPALVINGQTIFESGAICSYLSDLYSAGKMAPPISDPVRAKYEQWMYFAASTLDVFSIRMMVIEDIPAGQLQNEKMEPLLSEARDAFELLNFELSGKPFILNHQISTADLCITYHLYWCSLWPEFKNMMNDLPHLSDYLVRMAKRPAAVQCEVFSFKG